MGIPRREVFHRYQKATTPKNRFEIIAIALRNKRRLVLCLVMVWVSMGAPGAATTTNPGTLRIEVGEVLKNHVFYAFYNGPDIQRANGSFKESFDSAWEWQADEDNELLLVCQARHLMGVCKAAIYYQDDTVFRTRCVDMAEKAYAFLIDHMLDVNGKSFHSYYSFTDGSTYPEDKSIYDQAFALWALVEYYGLLVHFDMAGADDVLARARACYEFIEQSPEMEDPLNLGDELIKAAYPKRTNKDGTSNYYDNVQDCPFIHLLDAYYNFYGAVPGGDTELLNKLEQDIKNILKLINHVMISADNLLYQNYAYPSYTPIMKNGSKYITKFGNNAKMAYAIHEAATAIDLENSDRSLYDALYVKTFSMVEKARHLGKIAEESLHDGYWLRGLYDPATGAVSYAEEDVYRNNRVWWVQVEFLNAFLFLEKARRDSEPVFYSHFCEQWDYIKRKVVDHIHGGLFRDIHHNETIKGSEWKATFHDGRSFMNCAGILDESWEAGLASLDLAHAIRALQVLSGMNPLAVQFGLGASSVDVNGDGKTGLEEVIYIFKKVSGATD